MKGKMNLNWWAININRAKMRKDLLNSFDKKLFSQGKISAEAENEICKKIKSKYCILTPSGTSAIVLSLMYFKMRANDPKKNEVIISDRSWISPAHAAYFLNLKLVFVDTKKDLPLPDENDIISKINKKTLCVICVQLNGRAIDVNYINRVTKGVYEFGSVFKTFTLAAAFHEGIINPETEFKNLKKRLKCGKNTISEYDEKIPSNLTAEQILIRSGNIGSIRIGQSLGIEKFRKFMNDLGIINPIKFDIEETGNPVPFNWGKCKLATTSYGHGITTTVLQLANAYSTIVNGGYKINPTLIKKNASHKREKILNNDVSKKINPILRKIVTTKEGTASLANVEGYEVGGKTGTAQKSNIGGYSKNKINTFASIFPTSNPKYTLIVMLDEPKTNSEYIYHYRDGSDTKYKGTPFNTAGWTSVEVVGQINEKIGPILDTKYKEIK